MDQHSCRSQGEEAGDGSLGLSVCSGPARTSSLGHSAAVSTSCAGCRGNGQAPSPLQSHEHYSGTFILLTPTCWLVLSESHPLMLCPSSSSLPPCLLAPRPPPTHPYSLQVPPQPLVVPGVCRQEQLTGCRGSSPRPLSDPSRTVTETAPTVGPGRPNAVQSMAPCWRPDCPLDLAQKSRWKLPFSGFLVLLHFSPFFIHFQHLCKLWPSKL